MDSIDGIMHALAELRNVRERSASIDTAYDSSASLRHRAGRSHETLDVDYRNFAKKTEHWFMFRCKPQSKPS